MTAKEDGRHVRRVKSTLLSKRAGNDAISQFWQACWKASRWVLLHAFSHCGCDVSVPHDEARRRAWLSRHRQRSQLHRHAYPYHGAERNRGGRPEGRLSGKGQAGYKLPVGCRERADFDDCSRAVKKLQTSYIDFYLLHALSRSRCGILF